MQSKRQKRTTAVRLYKQAIDRNEKLMTGSLGVMVVAKRKIAGLVVLITNTEAAIQHGRAA